MSEPFRVLVLGGYGHFGGRISRALAADPSIRLTVAGRDAPRVRGATACIGLFTFDEFREAATTLALRWPIEGQPPE